ncbi:hypothetical protein L2725_05245 [Shewanella corallii]|uniref:Uncharacterized protein n=1 Tax=Shewanella corallii TaxID=560080 RepID=A0ABT0N4U9_9GAMM|nr:hypothetical protein [Shewanella corallii]
MPPRGLSKYLATKSKARVAEPSGQRLSSLSTALTLIYVEQLHLNRVALYKTTTKSCKNHLQRSTAPKPASRRRLTCSDISK